MERKNLLLALIFGTAFTFQAQTDPDSSLTPAEPLFADTTALQNALPEDSVLTSEEGIVLPDSSEIAEENTYNAEEDLTDEYAAGEDYDSLSTEGNTVAKDKKAAAQARLLQTANTLYNKRAYAEAIPYYEKARTNDSGNMIVLMKLGDCYRLTNNVTGKMHCYGELIRSGHELPVHNLYYGQALLEMGEPEKAREFFEKYTVDDRGQRLALSASKAGFYKKNADAYEVVPVAYNSMQNDYCAVKFFDAIVFASARQKDAWIKRQHGWTDGAYLNLYAAQKDESGNYSSARPFMGDLNSKYNDGPVSFSKDYNTVYFTRNNIGKEERAADGTLKLKIMEAMLDQNGFSMVKLMSFNNKEYNFAHPSISADGHTLYFASDMEGGQGGMDIYVCTRDSSGIWSTPQNLGDKVNTAGNEVFPFVAQNDVLYFSSNGHDGLGGLDIYETKQRNGEVTRVYNMGEPVNSTHDDFGLFLGEDLKSGFISSNRKAGGMDDDIYELNILRDVSRGKDVTLLVKDKESGLPVDSVKLVINGDTVMTDENGKYLTSAEDEIEYKIEAIKTDYFSAEDVLSSKMSGEEEFTKEIIIEKDPKLFLRALITDAKTGEMLEGATIRLTDLATNTEVDLYTTTASGDYFKFLFGNRIGDRLAYLVKIEKPGYLERTAVFTYEIEKPGEINMNDHMKLSLGKVEVGMDLAKMIDMKPIYFDLGKSTIRSDAAEELDKIVQVMNEHPNMIVELGSHTDCRSSASYNKKLSAARAKASANYIIKKGINKLRITSKGYGESKLLNNCACEGKVKSKCPEEEHAINRRTEFIITKLK